MPSLAGGKLLLALVAMVSMGYAANAQTTVSKTDKEALLAQRNQLVASGASTRNVDAQLLAHDVKFPANVTLAETATEKVFTFSSNMGFGSEANAAIYANRISQYAGIKAVAIDHRTGICTVTFSKTATETEITNAINRFGFDGYELVK